MSDLVRRLREGREGWLANDLSAEAADKIEQLERELAEARSSNGNSIKNCTIDLRGAGYDCVAQDGIAKLGVYGEGDKVLSLNGIINLSGLNIFGLVRMAEFEAQLAAERALADRLYNRWMNDGGLDFNPVAQDYRKARGL